MTSSWVNPHLSVAASPTVLSRAVDDCVVVYHPDTDEVSHLDPVGTIVWGLIEHPRPLGELTATLAESFAVDHATIVTDISVLLTHLTAAQLIKLD